MDDTAAGLLPGALRELGWPPGPECELVRQVLPFSGVWRLRWPQSHGGMTAIYKEAWAPLDREHIALRYAASAGIPVPRVLSTIQHDGQLGIIMTDLGESDRNATDDDAATIAAALHRVPGSAELPVIDNSQLASMPQRIADRARALQLPSEVAGLADRLSVAASRLAAPAAVPPVGLCHSEFHPTSVILQGDYWHTYDLARAFTGPGLLDLASWHGTVAPPDPDATAALITAYVKAGGHPAALDQRAGLPPEAWALGWHRIWAADWYCQQLEMGWVPAEYITSQLSAITRHLDEAVELLRA
jgi:hypothetical protein